MMSLKLWKWFSCYLEMVILTLFPIITDKLPIAHNLIKIKFKRPFLHTLTSESKLSAILVKIPQERYTDKLQKKICANNYS